MSSIPNSAMPTAIAEPEEGETQTLMQRATEQAGRIAGLARDNPKAAIAAGAAVAAGVAAAAAIPIVRAARRKSANGAAAPKADAATPTRKRAATRKTPSRGTRKS
jgi:hypothetical protein